MADKIRYSFLERQLEDGLALAKASDLVSIVPLGERPVSRYVVQLRCKGLVQNEAGEVEVADYFEAGIWFPEDYLRRAEPAQVLTWLGPRNVYHPNISNRGPFICVGRLAPGTPLVDLVYQVFEIVSWKKLNMREDDALNPAACAWARQNKSRLPIETRPLRRRSLDLEVISQ
jgi:hypothetical protein